MRPIFISIMILFLLTACGATAPAPQMTVTLMPVVTLTATPTFTPTVTFTPTSTNSETLIPIVGVEGLTLENGNYHYVSGDKVYDVDWHAVKDMGEIVQYGPWDIDKKTGKMTLHSYAAPTPKTMAEVANWREMAITWETDATGALSEMTLAQLETMRQAGDEAMSEPVMRAEMSGVTSKDLPTSWMGDKNDQFGMIGSVSYLPLKNGGYSSYKKDVNGNRPLKFALQNGAFGVKIYDAQGKQMPDLMHLSIVALDASNKLSSYDALVPKSELGKVVIRMSKGDRGVLTPVVIKAPKFVDMGSVRYIVEDKVWSDEPLRELMAVINRPFFASHAYAESMDWDMGEKYGYYGMHPALKKVVFDVQDKTGLQ